MCGRFVRKTTALEISDIFSSSLDTDELPISFNVAPTSRVLGIVNSTGGSSVVSFSWGLIPRWAPDASRAASLINARIETVAEKPSFRDLVAQHRCVIPMDGYFEWKEQLRHDAMKPIKQPFYFSARSQSRYSHQGVLAVAGLWTAWKDPNQSNGQVVHSAVALTTDANDMLIRQSLRHKLKRLLQFLKQFEFAQRFCLCQIDWFNQITSIISRTIYFCTDRAHQECIIINDLYLSKRVDIFIV